MLRNYLKLAWRNFVRKRKSDYINILGLALSLSTVVLIGLWIQNELRYDNYHPQLNDKFLIKNTHQFDSGNSRVEVYSPHNAIAHLQQDFPEVKQVAYCDRGHSLLKVTAKGQLFSEESKLYISKNWFNFFHYDYVALDTASFNHQPHSVILTEKKAKQYFGSLDILGKTLHIDSNTYTVHGVLQDNPANSSFDFDVLLPINESKNLELANNWMYFNAMIFVQTEAKAKLTPLLGKLNHLYNKNIQWTQSGIKNECELLPLASLHFDSSLPQLPFRPINVQIIIILSMLSAFLLLVGAINFVNYTLAKSFSRIKEFGTRKIVGADKKHLFIQILTEVFLNTALALLLAVLVASSMLPTFNNFFSLKLQLDTSGHIIQFLFLLWVVLIILSGVYPAAHLSSIQTMSLFRGADTLKFGSKKIRQGLLVVQTTLSLGMIIATLVMYKQLKFIQYSAESYNHQQTFTVNIPPIDSDSDSIGWEQHEAAVKKTLKNQLLMSPNVEEVSTFTKRSFLNDEILMVGNLDWQGKNPSFQAQYGNWPVDEDFNKTLNLQLQEGRWFYSGDSTDQKALILNETAVKDFQLAEPVIGTNMYNNGLDGVIIGVVKDFHFQNLREKIQPMVLYKRNNFGSSFIVKTTPNAVLSALSDVKQVMKSRFPNDIFTYRFIDDEFNTLYKRDQQTLAITLSLAIISIILCLIGLWGMILFESNQRTKEVGIRKVLGATALQIMSLLSKDFIKLILLAVILASPIAWWIMHKWLENFAYKIAIQWWMFAVAGLTAIAVALITVSSQVIKAAVANPVNSLRDE